MFKIITLATAITAATFISGTKPAESAGINNFKAMCPSIQEMAEGIMNARQNHFDKSAMQLIAQTMIQQSELDSAELRDVTNEFVAEMINQAWQVKIESSQRGKKNMSDAFGLLYGAACYATFQ